MTDNEIIKALECCCTLNGVGCRNCPQYDIHSAMCVKNLIRNALNLINRQKEEIERLKQENEFCHKTITENAQRALEVTVEEIEKTKSEVIKEFWNKAKEQSYAPQLSLTGNYVIDVIDGDNLVKEMTEVSE